MGNLLRKLLSCCHPQSAGDLGHFQAHVTVDDTQGCHKLANDLLQFEVTNQVPDGLDGFVKSSRAAQKKWYSKLLIAWREDQLPLCSNENAAQFLRQALKGHRKVDIEGLLSFYGLYSTYFVPSVVPSATSTSTEDWPKGVQYELHTLPVESDGAVDGDTLTVFVDASQNPREAATVPPPVQIAVEKWRKAQQQQDYKTASTLQKEIQKAGYKIIDPSIGTIARKYKIRLRGIDAPESSMPFGAEAKAMLQSLVENQSVRLLVYTSDRYGRLVADVHCNKGFIQEILLKNGACWHYAAYDKRDELAKWQGEACAKRLGLWKKNNPQKPWDYRKSNKPIK